jgi:cell wall-associated NlpC family hydrolase
MTPPFRGIATALALATALIPAYAAGQSSSSSTSSGVQVIDMNPPAVSAQKHAAKPPPKAPAATPGLPHASELVRNALAYVGTPYRKNGSTPDGFDSSGLAQFAFATVGVRIPRPTKLQFYSGRQFAGDPMAGDLVFFQTSQVGPSDVGIYLGDGRFLTSYGKDVHIDSFASEYFRSRYLGARRFL